MEENYDNLFRMWYCFVNSIDKDELKSGYGKCEFNVNKKLFLQMNNFNYDQAISYLEYKLLLHS